MTTAESMSQHFTDQHPETGIVVEGERLTADQFTKFADVFERKVIKLSRNESLSRDESRFIYTVADLGSRTAIYMLDKRLGALPLHPDDETRKIQATVFEKGQAILGPNKNSTSLDEFSQTPESCSDFLTAVQSAAFLIEDMSDPRLQDYARTILPFTATLTEENGLMVDAYLQGNLQALAARYEVIE